MEDQCRQALSGFAEQTKAISEMSREDALAGIQADDAETRSRAIRRMMNLRGPDVIAALTRALDDPAIGVRANAVLALSSQDCPDTLQPMLSAFRTDGAAHVRRMAAAFLPYHDDPQVTPALLDGLSDVDPRVVRAVCTALVVRKAVDAAPRIEELLEHADAMTRRSACESLLTLGIRSERLTATLESLLDDLEVREHDLWIEQYDAAMSEAMQECFEELFPVGEDEGDGFPRLLTTRQLIGLSLQPPLAD